MKVLAGARIPEGRLEADCPKSTRWIDPATSEWASDEDREADRHADRESRVRELRVWADGNEEDGKNNCEGTQAASQVIGHMSFTQSKLTALGQRGNRRCTYHSHRKACVAVISSAIAIPDLYVDT